MKKEMKLLTLILHKTKLHQEFDDDICPDNLIYIGLLPWKRNLIYFLY